MDKIQELFIVKSGDGYVYNSDTLEMITDPVIAKRLNYSDSIDVINRMEESGLVADLVKLNLVKYHA